MVNSTYLTITDHKYTQGQFSDTITGTIQNNSPQDVNFARVYAALYDNTNTLITVENGLVQLKAGDSSPFDIHIFSKIKSDIDHYTLFAAGTPL